MRVPCQMQQPVFGAATCKIIDSRSKLHKEQHKLQESALSEQLCHNRRVEEMSKDRRQWEKDRLDWEKEQ
jgi:hypothetical protein